MNRHAAAVVGGLIAFAIALGPTSARAASATAAQILQVMPSQEGVDCDYPKPDEVARCKVSVKKFDGHVGWIVESPEGVLLRKFLDTNGDNIVDQWSFFKDGVEVYRDIASKPSGKKDEFRWLNTAGTRWGLDANGTGKVSAWKAISAEEASAEIVASLAGRDADRFSRVLLSSDELQSLGLGKAKNDAAAGKISKAAIDFRTLADRQKTITAESKWVSFNGNRPGVVPAGTEESTRDIAVYENVVAIVQTGDRHTQVQIGTLVRVGDTWKTIDSPVISGEGPAEAILSGFFIKSAPAARGGDPSIGPSDESQRIIDGIARMEPGDPRRIEEMQKLVDQARAPAERSDFTRQLVDNISAAGQTGKMPDSDKRLQALWEKAEKDSDKNLAAYIKIRQLTTRYAKAMSEPKPDPVKIQAEWLKNLEQFISDYPTSPDAAEAMLQLGITQEYAGQDDDAKKWYARIGRDFADSPQAKKAAGAVRRLDSVGKVLSLAGKSPNGETVDLADYRGKVVLVQYWATWCNPAKTDVALKQLVSKYGRSFAVVGVCLDSNAKDMKAYLAENNLPWQQIFEEGGQDSRPANAMGIITMPTMILVDPQGKVVNRGIQTAEVEGELKKILR